MKSAYVELGFLPLNDHKLLCLYGAHKLSRSKREEDGLNLLSVTSDFHGGYEL